MKKIALSLALLAASLSTTVMAQAQKHPAYLHALSDLRAARWFIEHHAADYKATEDEIAAVKKIDEAIAEIKKASIDDGKNLNDHPKDEINEHKARIVKAEEYLKKAEEDVNKEEDNNFAQGLKHRAAEHIKEALRLAHKASQI